MSDRFSSSNSLKSTETSSDQQPHQTQSFQGPVDRLINPLDGLSLALRDFIPVNLA